MSSTLKIEKVPLALNSNDNCQTRFAHFVDTVGQLEVGESFVYELKFLSTHRVVITSASRLLKREYLIRKEDKGVRIGRIS